MLNFYTQIKKLKQIHNQPIVAYIDKLGYSGGYALACCADYVVSSPMARIGSVGNRWGRLDYTKQDAMNHISYYPISSSKLGLIFNEHTVFTDEQEELLQKLVDDGDDIFIDLVKDARPQLQNNEGDWNEAQKYTAYEALDLGMIDAIGSPIDAIKYISHDTNLKDIKFVFMDLTKPEVDKKK